MLVVATRSAGAEATVQIEPRSVLAGGTLTATGAGFKPDEELQIGAILPPDGRVQPLGALRTDDAGKFAYRITLSPETPPGAYWIVVQGAEQSARVLVNVISPAKPAASPVATRPPAPTPTALKPSGATEAPRPSAQPTADAGPGRFSPPVDSLAKVDAGLSPSQSDVAAPRLFLTPILTGLLGLAIGGIGALVVGLTLYRRRQ